MKVKNVFGFSSAGDNVVVHKVRSDPAPRHPGVTACGLRFDARRTRTGKPVTCQRCVRGNGN